MDLPALLGACFVGIGPEICCTCGRLPPFFLNVNPIPSLMMADMHSKQCGSFEQYEAVSCKITQVHGHTKAKLCGSCRSVLAL
jgi:hypothetical protein